MNKPAEQPESLVWVEILERRYDYPGVEEIGEETRFLDIGDLVPFPPNIADNLIREGKAKYYDANHSYCCRHTLTRTRR